jgi:WD40 repeat protein
VHPPSNWKPEEHTHTTKRDELPAAHLTIEHVYGYNGVGGRANLFYVPNHRLVYFVAGVGVVHDVEKNTQSIFVGHNEDITCMAVSPDYKYAATGQRDPKGPDKPYICIWEIDTVKEVGRLLNAHDKGINAISFDKDGKFLVSVGADSSHTVHLWDWEKGEKVATAQAGKEEILLAKFSPFVEGHFVTCGMKHLKFWNIQGDTMTSKKALYADATHSIDAVLDVVFLDETRTCVANYDGTLQIFEENKATTAIPAHKTHVGALCKGGDDLFISAGVDGTLCLWSQNFAELKKTIRLPESLSPGHNDFIVRALSYQDGKLAVGTKKNEIFEIEIENASGIAEEGNANQEGDAAATAAAATENTNGMRCLVGGHCKDVWGLAVHPTTSLFATCAEDKTLHLWDTTTLSTPSFSPSSSSSSSSSSSNHNISALKFEFVPRCCAWSPDGGTIVVGMGSHEMNANAKASSESGQGHQHQPQHQHQHHDHDHGAIALVDFKSFSENSENSEKLENSENSNLIIPTKVKFKSGPVNDIKFSPEGDLCAVASGHIVYVFETATWTLRKYEKEKEKEIGFDKHTSSVTHMDFSSDGKILMTNTEDYEIFYWDVESGEHVLDSSRTRDLDFGRWTCTLGWPVQGIWEEGADGTDVNAVCTSNSRKVLATGDDFGQTKLFKYPCVTPHAKARKYLGHSSHVTNVRFTSDNHYLLSTGGRDTAIFQWRFVEEH